MEPRFFATAAEFRAWLAAHHTTEPELLVGFYKTGSGVPSITWPESVDEALCFGWIDGVRRRLDERRYTIRFTPRRPGSTWSEVNTRRMEELIAAGRVAPAGLAAYAARDEAKTAQYSYEARNRPLDPEYEAEFRAHPAAWEWFQAQAPSFQRTAQWWVMSARQEPTRRRRLAQLVADAAAGRRPRPFVAERPEDG